MKPLIREIENRFHDAMQALGADADPLVRPAQDEKFGDYQSNVAMGLARSLGKKPRDVAAELVARLQIDDLCEPPEIAGPGFINLRIRPECLSSALSNIPPAGTPLGDRLGLPPAEHPQVVAVDLSSPNLAKEMHVGHLRSTVIGDCVCRILEFDGHTVHRENHVGDWGTQFGMLVAYLRRVRPEVAGNPESLVIRDLEAFYVEAKQLFDADDEFKKESRETVVALQQGDPATREIWRAFCTESLRHCHAIYDELGVRLIDRGESFYTDLMGEVVRRLEVLRREHASGRRPPDWHVAESDGALCIFMEGFKTRDGEALPLIARKSDGGYNYATSDLATIIHRVEHLQAHRIVYVVGLPQKQHFEMVFAAARKTGWADQSVSLEHLAFGSMLAASGRPFKTREGGTVKLKDLLDEAVERARSVVDAAGRGEDDTEPALADSERARIAETVGIGAVKYFDLSHSVTSDYKFDLENMLSLEGNTAPYMLYAYARIRSIGRRAGIVWEELPADRPILIEHPVEIALARKIVQFAELMQSLTADLRPNLLTDYLFELSRTFSRFYDKKLGVRVIDASPEEVRISRLRLCDLTARTLRLGLHLLGIDTLEKM